MTLLLAVLLVCGACAAQAAPYGEAVIDVLELAVDTNAEAGGCYVLLYDGGKVYVRDYTH